MVRTRDSLAVARLSESPRHRRNRRLLLAALGTIVTVPFLKTESVAAQAWHPPVRGRWSVEGYGPGEGDHRGRDHWAVDFFSDDSAIYPALSGWIAEAGWNCQIASGSNCYGNFVVLDHGDGLYTLYTHLADDQWLPRANRAVGTNDRIGTMSDSGCSGCGVHLHFAARRGARHLGGNALFGANESVKTPWR